MAHAALNTMRRILIAIGLVMALSLVLEAAMDMGHKSFSYEQAPVYAKSQQPAQVAGGTGNAHF